ncbi:hypothetical protein LCD33_11435, partial [Saccharopolyspora sp. 7B]|nr:hypothetical protein [Saccharopolyspora sp. 7B]
PTPERKTPATLRRLQEKTVPQLRELWNVGTAIGPHRLTPRMRTAQIGAAIVATGVLSTVRGPPPPPAPPRPPPTPRSSTPPRSAPLLKRLPGTSSPDR